MSPVLTAMVRLPERWESRMDNVKDDDDSEPTLTTMAEMFGQLEVAVLPEGWEPKGGLAAVRCMVEGRMLWVFRYFGDDISDEDALGVLTVQRELVLKRAVDSYEDG